MAVIQLSDYQQEMLESLRSGAVIRLARIRDCAGREALRAECKAALDELVGLGYAVRSARTGAYRSA